jgi:hypothetical protein
MAEGSVLDAPASEGLRFSAGGAGALEAVAGEGPHYSGGGTGVIEAVAGEGLHFSGGSAEALEQRDSGKVAQFERKSMRPERMEFICQRGQPRELER